MRRTKEESEQTRAAILDAAERVFCEHGYAVTTLDGVSRAAGVTRGAIYWHFKDKADILGALYSRSVLPHEQLLSVCPGHCSDPLSWLLETGLTCLREFELDEGKQRMFRIMSDLTISEDARSRLTVIDREFDSMVLSFMEQARDEGSLSPDFCPRQAAVFMSVTIGGLLAEWLRSDKAFPLSIDGEKLLRRHVAMLRREVACMADTSSGLASTQDHVRQPALVPD